MDIREYRGAGGGSGSDWSDDDREEERRRKSSKKSSSRNGGDDYQQRRSGGRKTTTGGSSPATARSKRYSSGDLNASHSLRGGVAFGSDRDRKPSKGSGGGSRHRRKGSVSRKHSS